MLGSHSVLLLDEQPHMAQRKLMLPPFHGERMKRYGELMAEVARERDRALAARRAARAVAAHAGVTLEVIIRAVFGVHEGERLSSCARACADARHGHRRGTMALSPCSGPRA